MLESVKNVFNFSVHFLSWLAFVVVFIITVVLYFVPLRFVINRRTSMIMIAKSSLDSVGDKQVLEEADQALGGEQQ